MPKSVLTLKKKKLEIERGDCAKCKLWSPKSPCFESDIQVVRETDEKRLMVVTSTLPLEDDIFLPEEWKLIRSCMREVRFDHTLFTSAVKCRRLTDPTVLMTRSCSSKLLKELQATKPKVIVCLGSAAAKAFGVPDKKADREMKAYLVQGIPGQEDWGHSPILLSAPSIVDICDDAADEATFKEILIRAERFSVEGFISKTMVYDLIESPEELRQYMNHVYSLGKTVVANDLETVGTNPVDPKTRIRTVGFSHKEGQAIVVPFEQDIGGYLPLLREFFNSPLVGFVYFNGMFDVGLLKTKMGLMPRNVVGDVQHMAYLLNPTKGAYGYALKPYSQMYTDLGAYDTEVREAEDVLEEEGEERKTMWETIDIETLAGYNGCDCDATLRLFNIFFSKLSEMDMLKVHKIMAGALKPLLSMQLNGVALNRDLINDYTSKLLELKNKFLEELTALTNNIDVDWNSPAQVDAYVYDVLKFPRPPATRSKKKKVDVDENALMSFRNPITDAILKYRRVYKLLHTYILGYFDYDTCMFGDRVRCKFHQIGTKTGRLSSSDPNLQNISARFQKDDPSYEYVKDIKIKNVMVATPGRVLVAIDMSQAEMRYAADVSGDEKLRYAFRSGLDFHSANVIASFGLEVDDTDIVAEVKAKGYEVGTKEYELQVLKRVLTWIKRNEPVLRDASKSVGFGIIYNMTKYGLLFDLMKKNRSTGIVWTLKQCEDMITNFKKLYERLAKYLKYLENFGKKNGYVVNKFGRRRWLPNIDHLDWDRKKKDINAAVNTPIQGGASDTLMCGLINIFERMDHEKSALLLTVHDSIVSEVEHDYIEEFSFLCKFSLEHPVLQGTLVPSSVPLGADVSFGYEYGNVTEVTDIKYTTEKDNPEYMVTLLDGYREHADMLLFREGRLEEYYRALEVEIPVINKESYTNYVMDYEKRTGKTCFGGFNII